VSGALSSAALASSPIAAILVLMLGLRWSAARAGLAGLGLAAALVVGPFGARRGATPGAEPSISADLLPLGAGVLAEGVFLSATILWILWPALALHLHQQRCGAIDALRGGLHRITADRPLQVLMVGWFLALFLEGAAGFGTPVALAAPILVGLGVAPLQAVVLALLGHAAGVSFGALGTPVLAQVSLTGLDPTGIAWRTALLHALLGGVLMAFFVRTLAAGGDAGGADRAPGDAVGAPGARWAAFAAAGFLLPCLALAATLGPELATLGAAMAGGAAFVLVVRRHAARAGHAGVAAPGLARALSPYAVLVGAVLLTRTVPPVAGPLGDVLLEWRLLDRYTARMQPLVHPGTLLFVALLVGARIQRVPLREVAGALARSARALVPVGVALLAMLCLSRLMLHAGMITALEQAAVAGLGAGWPLVAPAVGALGSFVTGSATASNVLFTTLQAQTAQALSLPVAVLVAAQGFGAAVGNVVCPHNVVAGAATVGLAGREAEILRRTLVPCLLYLALGGVLVAGLAALG
jgi:lactate permease